SVEVFKTAQAKGTLATHVGPRETRPITAKQTARVHEPKQKPTEQHEPVGVVASNGKDRSNTGDGFEEFYAHWNRSEETRGRHVRRARKWTERTFKIDGTSNLER